MRFVSLALLLGPMLLMGCGKGETPPPPVVEKAGEVEKGEPGGGQIFLTPEAVKTAGIVVRPLTPVASQGELVVPGTIETAPDRRAVVTPPVSGRVVSLLVRLDQGVRQGQALAEIESVDLAERAAAVTEAGRSLLTARAENARAASELALAQSRLRTVRSVLGRQRELAAIGAFSQPGLQAVERELSDARADLEGARREAVVHRAQLERSERLYRQELVSRVDLENARLDVEKDRIAQERAERAIGVARAAYEREREIARRGLSNAREVQAAEADVRAAELEAKRGQIALRGAQAAERAAKAAVGDARAAYDALVGVGNRAQGGRLTVTAPLPGRVVHREATVGQAVERTTELFEIDDLRSVFAVAQVPSGEIENLRRGAPVMVTTDAPSGRKFTGTVETVGGRLDPKTRTLPVRCRLPNEGEALRPEMFVRIALGEGSPHPALVLPREALFEEDGRWFVYVEETPGRYARRPVKLGREQERSVEIAAGLSPGVRVVVEGVFTLRSQARKDELKGED